MVHPPKSTESPNILVSDTQLIKQSSSRSFAVLFIILSRSLIVVLLFSEISCAKRYGEYRDIIYIPLYSIIDYNLFLLFY